MSAGQEVGEIFGAGSGPANSLLRSPTVIIAAVGLWGMNIYLFKLFNIDYNYVLTFDLLKEQRELLGKVGSDDEDGREMEDGGNSVCSSGNNNNQSLLNRQGNKQAGLTKSNKRTSSSSTTDKNDKQHGHTHTLDSEITSSKLILLSLTLLLTLHISTVLWIDYIGGTSIGAIFTFYILVLIGILLPIQSTSWIRIALTTIFHRVFELIHPRCFCLQGNNVLPRAIPFVDVFFADAMCSLSKVFFDWGMLWHVSSCSICVHLLLCV